MRKQLLALVVAAATSVSAVAADYYVVVPLPGKTADIAMTLGAATLPAARVGKAYTYDFNGNLSVTGDPTYSASGVTWAVPSGSLPAGLTLQANGTISGTPTVPELAGRSFDVLASYKTSSAQQAYSLTVAEAQPEVSVSGNVNGNYIDPVPGFGDVSTTSTTGVTKLVYLRNIGYGKLASDVQLQSPSGAYTLVGVYKGYKWGNKGDAVCASGGNVRTGCTADDAAQMYPHLVAEVKFKPTAAGDDTATLTFKHNGTPEGDAVATLTGKGVQPQPQVSVSGNINGNYIDPVPGFGDVSTTSTTGVTKLVYLSNAGGEGTLISDVKLESASGAYSIVGVYRGYRSGGKGDAICTSGGNVRTGCDAWDASTYWPHIIVEVKFKPTAAGADNATLTFTHNGKPTGPLVTTLTGNGVMPQPKVSLTGNVNGNYIDPIPGFGSVMTTSATGLTKYVYLSNVGSEGTLNSNVKLESASGAYTIAGVYKGYRSGGLGAAVCTSGTNERTGCTADDATQSYPHLVVAVKFKPTVAGDDTATLTLTHNGTPTGPAVATLTGTGVVPVPQVNVSGAYNTSVAVPAFGDVSTTSSGVIRRIFVRNIGAAGSVITDVSLTSSSTAYTIVGVYKWYKYDSKGTALCTAGGNSRTGCTSEDATSYWPHMAVEVLFKPTTTGTQDATLTLTHNGTPTGPAVVSLTGNGI